MKRILVIAALTLTTTARIPCLFGQQTQSGSATSQTPQPRIQIDQLTPEERQALLQALQSSSSSAATPAQQLPNPPQPAPGQAAPARLNQQQQATPAKPCSVPPANTKPPRKPGTWEHLRSKVFEQTGGVVDITDAAGSVANNNCIPVTQPLPQAQPVKR